VSAALAPAVAAPASAARSTSALSWGSPVVVDDQSWPGHREGTSQAIIDGNPAVSYIVWTKKGPTQYFNLYYSRANDPLGTSWGRAKKIASWYGPTSVDERTREMFSSLCQVNGKPAVCYGNDQVPMNRTLCYVRATDSVGSRWGDPITVDGSRNIKYPMMIVVNGNPAIKYWDWNNAAFYVRAEDPNGETWGTPAIVPGTSLQGRYFAIVNGNPAVVGGGVNLVYIRANDPNGDSWGAPVTIHHNPDLRYFRSELTIIGGRPAIAWSGDFGYGDLYYIRALDENGVSWPAEAVKISDDTTEDYFDSIVEIDGMPAIAFHSSDTVEQPSPLTLRFVSALDADGSAWETPTALASLGTMWHKSPNAMLAADGQRAGIAFMDTSHAMNFVGTLPAPPDPTVNVQLSTDKSSYTTDETDAVLTAVVTDEYGDPISGLGASAFATALDGSPVTVTFSESSTSGAYTGSLDISSLLVGDHTVLVAVTDTRAVSGNDSATFSMNEPGAGGTMHVGDLDASADPGPHGWWRGVFTVMIGDSGHNPVSGAAVSFSLSGLGSDSGQVTTGTDGTAVYQTGWIKKSGDLTFTVNDVTHATLSYSASENHDPDTGEDRDNTSITITGP